MEASDTLLSEVAWMARKSETRALLSLEVDSVVVHTACITTPTWMLTMLSYTTITHGDVPPILPCLA